MNKGFTSILLVLCLLCACFTMNAGAVVNDRYTVVINVKATDGETPAQWYVKNFDSKDFSTSEAIYPTVNEDGDLVFEDCSYDILVYRVENGETEEVVSLDGVWMSEEAPTFRYGVACYGFGSTRFAVDWMPKGSFYSRTKPSAVTATAEELPTEPKPTEAT
ncbi:MAG: hypothetical protein IIU14_06270 [Ruminococcus sp.]|nr:hypothetical protein [Ruminococcus sp.]